MSVTVPVAETPGEAWPRRTRAEELRLQLADDIVRGTLAPCAALDEIELARRFNVSRTPVREAIRMLAASGLVEVRAHRGAVVARPTHRDLIGMFEVMAELESLCAGYAAERMTIAERRPRLPERRAALAIVPNRAGLVPPGPLNCSSTQSPRR